MATSPNYSWPEPDNTDLVKNGALAMRTLGNAIDTTMATMTPKSTVTAKGSLIAATAASTPANLAVGNNGETLVADSSTSTGLRWQAPKTQNAIINAAFDNWQRGTSISTSTRAYTADRFEAFRNAAMTVSRQATGDTTNLPNVRYCARVQRDSGNTSTNAVQLCYSMETADAIPFSGKTATFSFYVRKGANFSATSDALALYFRYGTGTDENVRSGYTGAVNLVAGTTTTLTTTWQRVSYTFAVPAASTELGWFWEYTPTGTAGANDYFEVTGAQLEIGSVATPFNRQSGTIQGELAACQRYYLRYSGATSNLYTASGGIAGSTTKVYFPVKLTTTMRVKPSSIDYSGLKWQIITASGTISSAAISDANPDFVLLDCTSTGLTATTQSYILMTNANTDYLGFSAEL